MAPSSQNRLIAQAAREVLEPAGLVQKGRSRVWLDDHAWWLVAVEFQPALWDRGTYLNVGAMWLWHDTKDYVYFDLAQRVSDAASSDGETDEQFLGDVRRVAAQALHEVDRLRGLILEFEDVARQLRDEADRCGGWPAWDCAVAYGLAGDAGRAAEMFRRVADDDRDVAWFAPVREHAARLGRTVAEDPVAFRGEVNAWVGRYRDALGLPALGAPI